MCAVCGCGPHASSLEGGHVHDHGHAHAHGHDHAHDHAHAHGSHDEHEEASRILRLEADLLSRNDRIAQENRDFLARIGSVAFNLIGGPGSGKTSLLERTIRTLGREMPIAVLEGDQETDLDAERIRMTGVPVLQINTGSGCHLNAEMVGRSLRRLEPRPGSVVFVENVGNLVCPALFDVGEHAKILVASVTEGPEKPLKYPQIFREAHVLVLNKTDLLPHLDVGLHAYVENARRVNPDQRIFSVSCTKGIGLRPFFDWIVGTARAETAAARGG